MKQVLGGGFEYDEYSGMVTCSVCTKENAISGSFYYSASNGLELEEDEYIAMEFSYLKRNIIRHILSSKHTYKLLQILKHRRQQRVNC